MKFIEKLNTPVAVVVILAIFLAIDGFLLYGYQRSLPFGENVAATTTPENTASENNGERTDGTTAFVHRASSQDIVGNSTYVDHPSADENPDAILLVERSSESGGNADNTPPIGVWYDTNRDGKWAIFNQDLSPMSEDAIFEVNVWKEPTDTVFVHRVIPDSGADNETYIDYPSTNQNPDAVLSVTPNWNPGGGAGIYNDHPVSVRYDTVEEKWAILNTDLGLMPLGAAFNVSVAESAATPG